MSRLDTATPQEADAAYELVIDAVPMTFESVHESALEAKERTRDHLRKALIGKLERAGIDAKDGRYRLSRLRMAHGAHFADMHFCMARIFDNDRAAIVVRRFQFDGVDLYTRVNGRVIVNREELDQAREDVRQLHERLAAADKRVALAQTNEQHAYALVDVVERAKADSERERDGERREVARLQKELAAKDTTIATLQMDLEVYREERRRRAATAATIATPPALGAQAKVIGGGRGALLARLLQARSCMSLTPNTPTTSRWANACDTNSSDDESVANTVIHTTTPDETQDDNEMFHDAPTEPPADNEFDPTIQSASSSRGRRSDVSWCTAHRANIRSLAHTI